MKEFIPQKFRSRVLLAVQATGTGAAGFLAPNPGVNAITVRTVVTMGNAADLALTLRYADDTSGTNAADFPEAVTKYVDGVKQTDALTHTVTAATGNFIVDFCVDPAKIPAGKTIGLAYGNSNAANLLAATIIEDTVYKPTAS